jgi:Druantia protein DruA
LRSTARFAIKQSMELELTYRGKVVNGDDIAFINQLIAEHPDDSRRALSKKLCLAWNWIQPNGTLRDMVCRGLMLQLYRAGHISLPEKRNNPCNPFVDRKKPAKADVDQSPIDVPLRQLKPLKFCQVRRSPSEKLYNSLIQQHHYLGYCHPVGEQLKYIVYSANRPIACLGWSSAPRHIGCRDRHIGWSQRLRKERIHLLAYNTRFLILPWVRVKHLASHILGRMARGLSADWQAVYSHPIYYLETFVDKQRFAGTCYKAANWTCLGETTGRGKADQTHRPNRSIKAVWGYPLGKQFRKRLGVQ